MQIQMVPHYHTIPFNFEGLKNIYMSELTGQHCRHRGIALATQAILIGLTYAEHFCVHALYITQTTGLLKDEGHLCQS